MQISPDLRDAARIALARRGMRYFVPYTLSEYHMGWVHRLICDKLDTFLEHVQLKQSPRLILTLPPRHGKLCADSTKVLTVGGWKTHGELRPGDFVFHPSGKPVKVVAVSTLGLATHKVVFSNGEEVKVHLNHEWEVFDRSKRAHVIRETRYFIEPSPKTGKPRKLESGGAGRGHRYQFQVERSDALYFPPREHVLPPYVLGVWLGGGTTARPVISMSREDADVVKKEFHALGVLVTTKWVHKDTGITTFSFAGNISGTRNTFSQALKDSHLLGNKHIPAEYMYDSLENRMELLAGLIDSDGQYDSKTNRYRYVTTNERLADEIMELGRLCGYETHINHGTPDCRDRKIKSRKPIFVVSFFLSGGWIPCRLRRKQHGERTSLKRRLGITRIEELSVHEEGHCIQVDSPDGLYLVGKTLIPTHNSQLVSRCFPAFALGKHPDLSIIAASYSMALASRMNRDVQRIMDTEGYQAVFPHVKLSGVSSRAYVRTASFFEVPGGTGVYRSAGVGCGITGMGGDIIIIDDPIKDARDADSPLQRMRLMDWYERTLYTRLAPGAGILLIQTRWSQDDLAGRLIKEMEDGGETWEVLNFPALATHDEEYRKAGEPLHPERFDKDALLRIKRAVGSRAWAALYQQNPVPDGGALFQDAWFRFWDADTLPEAFDSMCISWDLAFKAHASSDFVAGGVWGRKGADFYLLDVCHERLSFTETVAAVSAMSHKWPRAKRIYIEDAANGPAVIDTLHREVGGIVPVRAKDSKEARAHAVTPLWEAGNVYIPPISMYSWVQDYITELTSFPHGAHDDMVDMSTQALREMTRRGSLKLDPALAGVQRRLRTW